MQEKNLQPRVISQIALFGVQERIYSACGVECGEYVFFFVCYSALRCFFLHKLCCILFTRSLYALKDESYIRQTLQRQAAGWVKWDVYVIFLCVIQF